MASEFIDFQLARAAGIVHQLKSIAGVVQFRRHVNPRCGIDFLDHIAQIGGGCADGDRGCIAGGVFNLERTFGHRLAVGGVIREASGFIDVPQFERTRIDGIGRGIHGDAQIRRCRTTARIGDDEIRGRGPGSIADSQPRARLVSLGHKREAGGINGGNDFIQGFGPGQIDRGRRPGAVGEIDLPGLRNALARR